MTLPLGALLPDLPLDEIFKMACRGEVPDEEGRTRREVSVTSFERNYVLASPP